MMVNTAIYPIGDQSFESVRKDGALYVDKSMYIEKLLKNSKYYFLVRPRRFGKSLFLSMLKCFFEGKMELFRGLYANSMDWDWPPYPVLYLDMNVEQYQSPRTLEVMLRYFLNKWEETYGVTGNGTDLTFRFKNVIKKAAEVTGKSVVSDQVLGPITHLRSAPLTNGL